MTRPSRARPEEPLERLLEQVHVVSTPFELRPGFVRLLMRAAARSLFSSANCRIPAQSRLFTLSPGEAAREERLGNTNGFAERLSAATATLLELSAAQVGDLPHALGGVFETLAGLEIGTELGTARLAPTRRRKRTGTFYTPGHLAEGVASVAIDELLRLRGELGRELLICDPACGSGAFLVEAARALFARLRGGAGSPRAELELRREIACRMLAGVDVDPDALAVAELSLFTFVGDEELLASAIGGLFVGDALTGPGLEGRAEFEAEPGLDWARALAARPGRGFDLVIGNPPWVAFAGRAAQPLAPARREFFARNYQGFRGYPTLQALFVERSLELAPDGVIALLVPSPLADLDGYRALRRRLLRTHEPREPLLEFGGDAFTGVAQPCFALVARPRTTPDEAVVERGLVLAERARLDAAARTVDVPRVLSRLADAEPLPRDLFGELGFQTTRIVTERLLLRSEAPAGDFVYPLLEGKNVQEFRVGEPRLFLHPDERLLAKARCRLRDAEAYRRVRFVVRQTAKAPIAAMHSGLPFRNTLLAGFDVPEYPPELVVGLLNSSLYRALHLARQRDGRQSLFPQVKIGHLRSLPRPPREAQSAFAEIAELTRAASSAGPTPALRAELDRVVFGLFGLAESEQGEVLGFLRERAPELGRKL